MNFFWICVKSETERESPAGGACALNVNLQFKFQTTPPQWSFFWGWMDGQPSGQLKQQNKECLNVFFLKPPQKSLQWHGSSCSVTTFLKSVRNINYLSSSKPSCCCVLQCDWKQEGRGRDIMWLSSTTWVYARVFKCGVCARVCVFMSFIFLGGYPFVLL